MRKTSTQRDSLRQACIALASGLPLLGAGAAKAADYDRDNQFGAVTVHDSNQTRLPLFERSKELGAITVNDRDRSPYQPEGIQIGNYLVSPEVSASILKDDNLFGTKVGDGDIRRQLAASMVFTSRLPRHLLDFAVYGRMVSFQNHDERNFADGGASVLARLDITYNYAILGNFVTKLNNEELRDGETPKTAKRTVEILDSRGDLSLLRTVGRLTTQLGASAERKEYHAVEAFDGSLLPQSFRDTDFYSAYLKARYQISPGYTLLAQITGLTEQNRGTADFNRSNRGYEATAGVEFEPTRLLRASVSAGLSTRNYDNPVLADIQTAIFDSGLVWMILPTLTANFRAQREVNVTSVAGASGRVDTRAQGSLEYEFQRNIVLKTGLSLVSSDFSGTSRHDNIWVFTAGAQYFFNKNVFLSLDFEHDVLTSSAAGTGYEANKIMASVKFRH